MKPRSLGSAFAAALLVLAMSGAASADTPRIFFSPNGGGAQATAEMIDRARQYIDVGMYSTSNGGPIWQALQRAIARGVVVRMVLNEATGANAAKAEQLAGIGVHVFGVRETMHEKFAIIDGRWLINGSANWSMGAETRYSENTAIYEDHPHLVYAFQEEFNLLLRRGSPVSPNAASAPNHDQVSAPGGSAQRRERPFFSSRNASGSTLIADEIIAMMQTARESILIDVAHFNSRKIAQALIRVRQQRPQLRIEVLLDLGEYADPKSRARELEAARISVRYKTYSLAFLHPRSQLQHHKNMVVDGVRMVTGSYNWSDTAESKNWENIITIDGSTAANRPMVQAVVGEHERLWNMGRDRYREFRAAMTAQPGSPAYRRILPVHFDTPYFNTVMSLTRNEIRPVRSAAFRAGLLERDPDTGRITIHSEVTYLDRETNAPYTGPAPTGRFLAPSTGITDGLDNH